MSVSNNSMHIKPKIGIIGGMGPEATVLLMSRIISLTDATDDSDHIPLIVDNNTQVPSRIKALIDKTGDDPGPTLAKMAKGLELSGAQALAMPCNTAHYYAAVIEDAVEIPFLNMIELTAQQLSRKALASRKVGILGSPALALTGIFKRALSAVEIETIYPAEQNLMLDAIRAIKKNSRGDKAGQILQNAATELIERGAGTLLIACSEFSLISDCLPQSYHCIDSIDVLAQAVIDF